jgi:tRNA (cytidine/uridine-2'-O-)-methyltransferase
MIAIALYQPDIAPNAGAIFRLAACFGIDVHVIEPTGFLWNDARLRRAGMDYLDYVDIVRQSSWAAFRSKTKRNRIVLITTKAEQSLYDFGFETNDIVLMGRETAGVPEQIHDDVNVKLRIPMRPGLRSLNVAMACAIAVSEALRQTGGINLNHS